MTSTHKQIRLFETVVDECPYLEDQQSASILVDPDHPIDSQLFATLSRSGFRRSGEMLYSPRCPTCKACISVRIPASSFRASKSQRRVWRKNLDLSVTIEKVSYKQEHFDLYLKYQSHRHPESSMCDDDPAKYTGFIESGFSNSRFLCLSLKEKLIGISIMDQFDGGLSAVYTFFDPEYSNRSLGTFAILYLAKLARVRGIPFVYLGYWIDRSQKMDYKRNFKPLQGYQNHRWADLDL